MMWHPRPKRSLRVTDYAPDVERDVREELELHLELRTQELVDAGYPPEEARRMAREAFGDTAQIIENCENTARSNQRKNAMKDLLTSITTDVRYGLRHLARRRSLAAVVVATWALCIGANVAIFSLVDGILLRPLPYPDSNRLVAVYGTLPKAGIEQFDSDMAQYLLMREHLGSLESIALHNKVSTGIGEPGAVQNVFTMDVTSNFFETLGVVPMRGRAFTAEDGRAGAAPVVILRQDLADSEFGPGANAIGRTLETESGNYTVVGLLPNDFVFADWEARLWFPLTIREDLPFEQLSRDGGYSAVGRLRTDANLADLETELVAFGEQYLQQVDFEARQRAIDGGFSTLATPLKQHQVDKIRPALLLLWGGVLLVLILGCVNIATLLLVRNTMRMRELAIRFSLGATRRRIARQLATESVLLALAGGGLGLALGTWSLGFLTAFEAYEIPRLNDIGLDGGAVALTLLVTTGVGLVAGLIPALFGPFRSPQSTLRSGGRDGLDHGPGAIRGFLVATQVALAFVLLVGAALFGTSLYRAMSVDPGLETENVLAAATVIPWDRYGSMPQRNQFISTLLQEFEATPGVVHAAIASQLPFSDSEAKDVVFPQDAPPGQSQVLAIRTTVSPSYFATLGIPILAGRGFDDEDSARTNPAVVVDEVLAAKLWPGEDAVGQRVRFGDEPIDDSSWATVVGVVGAVVQNDPTEASREGAFYLPARDSGITFSRLAFRTEGDPMGAYKGLKEALLTLDPQGRFFWVLSMEEALSDQLVFRRLPALMILSFALTSLLLSVLGVYGVLAQSVTQRSSEIGLRLALGGSPTAIVPQILRQGFLVVGAGIIVGTAVSLGLSQLASGMLFGVKPNSPSIYLVVGAVILASTLVSSLVPARRALRVDVVATLKGD